MVYVTLAKTDKLPLEVNLCLEQSVKNKDIS